MAPVGAALTTRAIVALHAPTSVLAKLKRFSKKWANVRR